MLRLLTLLMGLGLAFPAVSACPEVIRGTDWSDGRQERVIGRKGDQITYHASFKDSGDTNFGYDLALHLGVIPLSILQPGADPEYFWTTPLPKEADLVPGARFEMRGEMTGDIEILAVTYSITVLGSEAMTVAGCSYEVLQIQLQSVEGQQEGPELTYWLHLPSLMALRKQGRGKTGTITREVVALQ